MEQHIKKARNGQKEAFESQVNVPVTLTMRRRLEALAEREGGVPLAQLVRRFVVAGLSAQGGGL